MADFDASAPEVLAAVKRIEALQRSAAAEQRATRAAAERAAQVSVSQRIQPRVSAAAGAPGLTAAEGGGYASTPVSAQLNPQRAQALRGELQRLSVVQAQASQQMRRHGALTTEFLQALIRGEATLSEFRFQISSTILKFAGWTAAASAVYGVVAAVRTLGTGAIDSLSGVNQLSRYVNNLDTDRAQQQFRNLARELNVPIGTVVEATSGVAKVYNNQADALKATETVLKAVRTAELEAGDATKYFAAIARGAGLEAGQLAIVLDQINNAQNKLGVSTSDSAQGLARATAQYKNAGGSLNQLIALMATLQAVTGESGSTIGTALSRSASYIQRPGNKATLQRYGIDPNGGIDKIIQQAVALAPRLSGEQRLDLAGKGLSSPQYGRFFTALLSRPEVFRRAEQVTSPGAARGQTDKELRQILNSTREQIKRIGIELQNLGSALAQSGALNGLGVAVRLLSLSLQTLTQIIELIDKIPQPFRQVGIYVLELYAGLALLRRTSLGNALARETGVGFLGSSPERSARRGAIRTSGALEKTFADESEQLANRAATAQITAVRADEYRQILIRQQAAVAAGSKEYEEIGKRLKAQERLVRTSAVEAQAVAAQQETMAYAQQQQLATTRKLRKGELTPAQAGIFYAPTGGLGSGATTGAAAIGGQSGELTRAQQAGRAVETRMRGLVLAANLLTPTYVQSVASTRAATAASLKLSSVAGRFTTAAGELAGATRGLGGRIATGARSLAANIGPLEAATIAFVGGELVIQGLLEAERKKVERLAKFAETPPSRKAADDLLAEARGRLGPTGYGGDNAQQVIVDRLFVASERARRNTIRARRAQGGAAPQAYFSEINEQFTRDQKTYKDYGDLRDAANRRIQEVLTGIYAQARGTSNAAVQGQIRAIRLQLAQRAAQDPGTNPFTAFSGLNREDLGKQIDVFQKQAQLGVKSQPRAAAQVTAGLLVAAGRYSRSKDADALQAVLSAEDALTQAITGGADKELQTALQGATTSSQRQGAYRSYFATVNRNIAAARRTRSLQTDQLGTARGRLAGLEEQRAGFGLSGPLDPNAREIDKEIADQRSAIRALAKRLGIAGRALAKSIQAAKATEEEKKQAAFEAQQQDAQIRVAYEQSRTTDPTEKIQIAIRGAYQSVRDAIKKFGRGSNEALQAITAYNNLLSDQAQSLADQAQQQGDLRTSTIYTQGTAGDIQRVNSDIQTARSVLSTLRANGGTAQQINEAQINLNRLTGQRVNLLKQQAQEQAAQARQLAEAKLEYQLAGITDPVARARADLQGQQRLLKGLKGVDRIQQLTKIRESRTTYQQALIDADVEDLQFRHDIGKLTDDQYITGLKQILASKKLTKEQRRQLLREVHDLENQQDTSNLELNVGNIRIPTFYEVRRALARGAGGGGSATQVSVSNRNNYTFHIGKGTDLEKLGTVLQDSTSLSRSAARAAGLL